MLDSLNARAFATASLQSLGLVRGDAMKLVAHLPSLHTQPQLPVETRWNSDLFTLQWVERHFLSIWVTLQLIVTHQGDITLNNTTWSCGAMSKSARTALRAAKMLSPVGLEQSCQLLDLAHAATKSVSRVSSADEAP